MITVLAVSFLLLFYIDTIESLQCNYCRKVDIDNKCSHVEKSCSAGKSKFCYTRMVVRGGRLQRVERGCSMKCRTMRFRSRRKLEEYMLCCDTERCNQHKVWNGRTKG